MKILIFMLHLTFLTACWAAAAQDASLSPAQLRSEAAQKVLAQQPSRFQAYNDLALAMLRRARETGDPAYFSHAQSAIESSWRIQPQNFEAGQAHVALLLAEKRYRDALDEARVLNHRMPDAVLVWGDIAEAEAALGDYSQAEEAAQWMMNLRPGNLPAYLCGAALRQDWGDLDGALDFLDKALQQTPPLETEETAWILTRMAAIQLQSGRTDPADALLRQALKTFPDYHLSLETLAKVRLAQQRYSEALESLAKLPSVAMTPSRQLLKAQILERAGRQAEAERIYADFERDARVRISEPDNANAQLVAYYVDHSHQPQEALRIARMEMEIRHDVSTLDAYAWALEANGQHEQAVRQIEKALAVGARDATLFYHAGTIEAAAGHQAESVRDWQQSLALNPASDVGEAARHALNASEKYAAVRYGQ
jgi:tetratricopeptide (TPR) repeat protein